MSIIRRIESFPLEMRMRMPFITSKAAQNTAKTVLVRLETDYATGYGETAPRLHITGETPETASLMINNIIAPIIVGRDVHDFGLIRNELESRIVGNPSAKIGVDLALLDALGKTDKIKLSELIGGSLRDSIKNDAVISAIDDRETVKWAENYVKQGFKRIKVKVGGNREDPDTDIRKIKFLRESLGEDIKIKIDVNGAWSRVKAKYALRKLEKYNIEVAEQPVPYWDLEGLYEVKNSTSIPIMADESVFNSIDAARVLSSKGVDYINIKLIKTGTIKEAIKIAQFARLNDVGVQIGSTMEGSLISSAKVHFASTLENLCFSEIIGPQWIQEEPFKGLEYDGPSVRVPRGYGLGIKVDEEHLKDYVMDIQNQNRSAKVTRMPVGQ